VDLDARDREELVLEARYAGYVERERGHIEQRRRSESRKIPHDLEYASVPQLRHEAREKFSRIRPETIGQAERISGIGPADIGLLLVHLKVRGARSGTAS